MHIAKKVRLITLVALLDLLLIGCLKIQAQTVTKTDYRRAERFLPQNIHKLVFRSNVQPHWASDSPVFWYRVHTKKGEQYFLVDAKNQTKKPFFNQKKLAKKLSNALNKHIKPYDLPLHQLDWNHDKNTFRFRNKGHVWKVNLKTLQVSRIRKNKQANNRLSSTSPNGKWTVTRQNYNLFLTNNETGKETQLTEDGTKHFIYGAMLPWAWMKQVGPISKKSSPLRLDISWSQNSNMFYAPKLDLRKAKKMYLLQNVPKKGLRSRVFSYYRALPGDDSVATIHPFVFNVQSERKTPIQIKPYAQLTQGRWIWSGSNLYSIQRNRGYKSIALLKANTKTGKVDTLFHRSSKTYIDPLNFQFKFLPKTHEL
ncbi:MAG TPA: DPP IV N-terminal domain-containing protein, partial [Balneolaceae bacterium]|nr:DPP IV N-terminal domain-containing protein [Balneolaceae bacterium]